MDKSKKGVSPIPGYPGQGQVYLQNEHPSYIQPSNQNGPGSKEIPIEGLMTFKQFTLNQDDGLSPVELLEMYDVYRTKCVQRHQLEFLENNRSSPFILEKFHPIWIKKILEERKILLQSRRELFINKLLNGKFNSIKRSTANLESNRENFVSSSNEVNLVINDSCTDLITIFEGPHCEADIKSHILIMTDIPIYISHLDILNFLNNDFPLLEGGFGKCSGFLDISLSTPKFTRGILNRQCYILFDSIKNRSSAVEMMKGKTIKSSFTTHSIMKSYINSIGSEYEPQDSLDATQQPIGGKYSIYIIQTKIPGENNFMRFGTLPKVFSTDEQLNLDRDNMLKIIEKLEREQNIDFKIKRELDTIIEKEIPDIKFIVDILSFYLRFVHGIDYYSFFNSNIFQRFPRDESQMFLDETLFNKEELGFESNELVRSNEVNSTIQANSKLIINQQNMLLLSRGYIDIILKSKFRGGWLRDDTVSSESLIYKDLMEENQLILKNLEENVETLLSLPSLFNCISDPILDTDDTLSSAWRRYCEQHTLRKKADRWQCGKCLKQFKGEEFVHKHLAKKHGDFLENIREDITFERIIRPLSEKFSYLICPTNVDELNIGNIKKGYNHLNNSGMFKPRYKYQRSAPYDKKRSFKDWDTPKQNQSNLHHSNNQNPNDIRMSVKYDDL